MGIDHQPASGANENDGTGSLTQQFSLLLKSDPMRAQKLVFELSITRFCDELERFGSVSNKDLARLISTKPPHKTVEEIRDFFEPCFDASEEELRRRLAVVFSAVESTVPEHVALNHKSASLTKDAFCGFLLCQSALCIGSHELSRVIRDTESEIEKSIIEQFQNRIVRERARIVELDSSRILSPEIKQKAFGAIYDQLSEDSEKLKLRVKSRIDAQTKLSDSLTAHSVERLHEIVPPALEEYLQQPFKEALTRYIRAEFESPFKSEISLLHRQIISNIDAALRTLRESMG